MVGEEPQPDSHKGGTACLCKHTVDWAKGQDGCWLPCQADHLTCCSRSLTVLLSPHTGISGYCRPGLSKSDTAVLHGLRHSRPAMQSKKEVRSVQGTRQCPHHSLASSCAAGPCSNVPASQAHANGSVLNRSSCSCALVCVHTSPVDVPAATVCDTRCRIALHGWRACSASCQPVVYWQASAQNTCSAVWRFRQELTSIPSPVLELLHGKRFAA